MTFTYLCFFLLTLHAIIVTSSEEGGACYEVEKASGVDCIAPRQWITEGECSGSQQSPINIVTKNTKFNHELAPFHFTGYDTKNDFNLTNNGHSAQLSLEGGTEMTISGGGLTGTYKALQLHFHWGNTDMLGSEHSIDGERYAAELHIVHSKVQSGSRSDSGGTTTGGTTGGERTLAVLGFFIEETKDDNGQYANIIQALNNIQLYGNKAKVSNVILQNLIPEEKYLEHFYRYDGSLTTVPCSETVTWTVFSETIKLGKSQLEAFYAKLNYTSNIFMVENFRPVQKLGERTVYTSGVEAVLSHSRNLLLAFIVAFIVSTS